MWATFSLIARSFSPQCWYCGGSSECMVPRTPRSCQISLEQPCIHTPPINVWSGVSSKKKKKIILNRGHFTHRHGAVNLRSCFLFGDAVVCNLRFSLSCTHDYRCRLKRWWKNMPWPPFFFFFFFLTLSTAWTVAHERYPILSEVWAIAECYLALFFVGPPTRGSDPNPGSECVACSYFLVFLCARTSTLPSCGGDALHYYRDRVISEPV